MEYTREQAEQVFKDFRNFKEGITVLYDSQIDFLKHKFPTLPEKGWLKCEDGAIIFRTGIDTGYGSNEKGEWEISDEWTFGLKRRYTASPWQPATEEEVINMLTEQAEKMGYVNGVKVKCLLDEKGYTLDSFLNKESCSMYRYGTVWFLATCGNSVKVMQDGKWAEIIADDLQERFDALVKEAKERGKNVTVKFE
jgi:hypothetical protein